MQEKRFSSLNYRDNMRIILKSVKVLQYQSAEINSWTNLIIFKGLRGGGDGKKRVEIKA